MYINQKQLQWCPCKYLSNSGCQAGIGQGQKLACQYLVAADGAGSSVRELAGVQMEGDENLQELISVHFMSKQLGQRLLDSVPGMLYFVFNQRVIAVIVAHNLEAGEFVAQVSYLTMQLFDWFLDKEIWVKVIEL
jgi:2-polyprenyl-6-methoxyphenol hydroxylase-like FAD-dependent oxidoreductase